MRKVANNRIFAETTAELWAIAGQKRFWLGGIGIGLAIGIAGPFGTYDMLSVPVRCAYWLVVVVTTFWIGYAVSFATAIWAEARGISALAGTILGATMASLPVTAWLAGLHALLFASPYWADMARLLPYVLVITIAVVILSEALEPRATVVDEPLTPLPYPTWLDQLPAHLGRDLILIQAQDHYVRAETRLGDTLIRARLHDVAQDLGDFGVRLHRSWWVARAAIKSLAYRNGSPVVVLQDGRDVPIGRTYRRAVREALQQERGLG